MLRVSTRPDEFDVRCCPLLKHNTPFITSGRQAADSDSFVNAKGDIMLGSRGMTRNEPDIHPVFKSSENPERQANRSTRQSLFQLRKIRIVSDNNDAVVLGPENSA